MTEAVLLMLVISVFIMPIAFIKLIFAILGPINTILSVLATSMIGYFCFSRIVILQSNITMLVVILAIIIIAELYSVYLWSTDKALRDPITALATAVISFGLAIITAIALVFLSTTPIC